VTPAAEPVPPAAAPDPLERWEKALRWVPYATLLFASALTLVIRAPHWGAPGPTLALAAAVAGWLLLAGPRPGQRVPGPLFFAVLIALTAVLVLRSAWYGFFAFVGYLYALDLLPGRWRFVGLGLTAVLAGTAQIGGLPREPALWLVWAGIVLVNALLAGGFAHFGQLIEQQNRERKQTIDELNETNAKLAAAMEENVGLQAQLLVQAREAGKLDERQRLAEEIHDTIAQGLTGIVAQLQAADRAGDRPVDRDRHVATAAELARQSLAEARRSVQALRPEQLEAARLPEALADVAASWSELTGVPASVTTTGTARQLHPEVEVALLRTGQEALTNVAKHAAATRVGVTLSYMEDVVTLDVRDDGVGFEPAAVPGTGFGLSGMRQRVQRVAGSLEVESAPGEGTAVSATVPAIPAGSPA
jgi:signal transduction histidine kinase